MQDSPTLTLVSLCGKSRKRTCEHQLGNNLLSRAASAGRLQHTLPVFLKVWSRHETIASGWTRAMSRGHAQDGKESAP